MTEPENVFLRWARLKQASKEQQEAAAVEAPIVPPADIAAATDEPFDPASLPSIESIVAETDIVAFLRAGVPAELTRAALRRTWASDPAIRDFIGIAENQWDFNDPDAMPGFGSLDPSENPADLLAQVSRRLECVPDALGDLTEAVDPDRYEAIAAAEPVVDSRPAAAASPPTAMPIAQAESEPASVVQDGDLSRTRRHGSALPR